ncbi:MAG TPA: hypothetical protein VNJ05_04585 [Sphingomicrobium sp.]|nr:hypothetical protein [Sphingomicrobium sp.]
MLTALSIVAAPLLAASAFAQSLPPPTEPSEIVVEGSKDRDRQVRQFVDALTDAPIGGQLSRFDWEVCPVAVGLTEPHNGAVARRMRAVAEAAGIRTAPDGCKPNALVIVADDKQDLIEALWRQYPAYFTDPQGRRSKPAITPGPATAWHVERVSDPDGVTSPQDLIYKFYVTTTTDSTRLLPATRPHFAAGILVVERKALTGLTAVQLADYAAMRIFARTDPARLTGNEPTILTILDRPMDAMVPVTLTEWDLGFLKGLYASRDRQYASRQRHEIETRMRKELARSPTADSRR